MIESKEMKQYRIHIAKRVVFLAVLLFVLLGSYTVTMMYNPIQEQLRQGAIDNHELSANNKRQTLEEVIGQYKNVASALASRSAMRDLMVSYLEGEIEYDEMIEFIEPKYKEGIEAFGDLKGISYVARIMKGQTILEKGIPSLDVIKHIEEHPSVDEIHLEMIDEFVLCVISPIMNGEEQVGYDLLLADLSLIIEELEEEKYDIRLLESNTIDHEDVNNLVVKNEMEKLEMFFYLSVEKQFIYGEGDQLLQRLLIVFVIGILFVFIVVMISILRFSNKMFRRIQEKEEILRFINGVTGEGIWDWNIREDRVYHNEKWCSFFGMDHNYLSHETQAFLDRIYPEDLALVNKRINDSLESGIAYLSEHRMTRLDGSVFWVKDRGAVVDYDHKTRQPNRMVGSLQDITRRKV
ncbi:MAG: PAS domain-containing protein, partial [Vallitaleaceae bacterium]|nr:PAS domain-containing protein [Vallitaleaceae bacterium]